MEDNLFLKNQQALIKKDTTSKPQPSVESSLLLHGHSFDENERSQKSEFLPRADSTIPQDFRFPRPRHCSEMNGAFRESIRDDSTLVYEVYEPVLRYVAYISSVNQLLKIFTRSLCARRADEWNTERAESRSSFRRKRPWRSPSSSPAIRLKLIQYLVDKSVRDDSPSLKKKIYGGNLWMGEACDPINGTQWNIINQPTLSKLLRRAANRWS